MDTTRKVLETIRNAHPPRLYIASDGPRKNMQGDEEKVKAVREYVMGNIDWDCKVKTLFRGKNLGCRKAVSEAVTWFFENEEQGIILEDDCLPSQSFFWFSEELLEKYKDNPRVMHISGNNLQHGISRTPDSYYFSCYTHIWGWASWRRAWKCYDIDMNLWNKEKISLAVREIGGGWKPFEEYWIRRFEEVFSKKIDTWDYVWLFSCWMHGGLAVIPEVNIVENIGFGPDATHTKTQYNNFIPERSEIQFPLRHPKQIVRCLAADRYTDRKHYCIRPHIPNFLRRFLRVPYKAIKIMRAGFMRLKNRK
ncbi:MAG: nucleotide-diphospho-sugar transferase [Candidatus Omnitrophica bacterium]|nr:nucleotide-diphospho-sugar transferase [Candidatus Omnitrophota bacterium]